MQTRNKLWIGLGVVCVAGGAIYLGASEEGSGMSGHSMTATGAEGGEGGEGAAAEDALTDDAAYLTQLGLIRGHLNVGVDLYREGEEEASATHMKHPEDELYADLLPALEARQAPGFAEQLAALATAVEQGQPVAEVDAAYEDLLAGISRAEQAVGEPSPAVLGKLIVGLVQVAAAEYDIAVGPDGQLENAHEYQDALGFVRIAQQVQQRLAAVSSNTDAVTQIGLQLEGILPAWTGLLPPQRLSVDPSLIYSAASRIEIATLSL